MLAGLFCIGSAGAVHAQAIFTVTNVDDSGAGSLRQAIADANGTTAADIIEFAPALAGQTIVLTSGVLEVTSRISVNGLGADRLSVSGNDRSLVFQVHQTGDLTIRGLTITGGNNAYGGGIDNAGTLTVSESAVIGNTAFYGGGLFVSPVARATVIGNSTFGGNTAQEYGGGIYVGNNYQTPPVSIVNSTISSNSAGLEGGGIFGEGDVSLVNVTITGNEAATYGGGLAAYAGALIGNTIVAGNLSSEAPDVFLAGLLSSGHNLVGADDWTPNWLLSDQLGTTAAPIDARLGALQDNGGSTLTHALLPGSPAIDSGSNALAIDALGSPLLTDQRGAGAPRVANVTVDIGAFEVQPASPAFDFTGFFAPVDNLPVLNIGKAGSAVPLKFSLNGDRGLAIFAAGYPAASPVMCDANELGSTLDETVAAGTSGLTYDVASDRYQYVWKTNKAWKGSCRMLVVRFVDGSEHYAKFSFK